MIIKDIVLISDEKKMLRNLQTASTIHSLRKSWIIKIISKDNIIGYGEASILDGFNMGSFDEVGYALEGFKIAVRGIKDDIDLSELLILADVHTIYSSSAHFAVETALYDIESKINSKTLCSYLNTSAYTKVAMNGIEGITTHTKYNVIKIKAGFRNLYDEKKIFGKINIKIW